MFDTLAACNADDVDGHNGDVLADWGNAAPAQASLSLGVFG